MRANILKRKLSLRVKRKKRIRADIFGTTERPRISVFKSNRYLYVQAIDDVSSVTLASADGSKLGLKSNKEGAVELGKAFAATLKEKNLTTVVFDRNGYLYHGVVAAFADALRENGIQL
ncbi:MAG: large subunit ribosomal protein [Sulfurospirillum sp.]|jgi:large subunit ribosomal protein L18|nr:large subunit ribosomal protein [Sulfurospirillum sp.]DAB33078.1 MAG TPA: 50S ribosomal protein L18 [Sulfurospirillum sp. UBA11407]DAB34557.1 MAG TPA: 50S ribosomal protein L18 [Sulfurospirillum sp. UBA12182]